MILDLHHLLAHIVHCLFLLCNSFLKFPGHLHLFLQHFLQPFGLPARLCQEMQRLLQFSSTFGKLAIKAGKAYLDVRPITLLLSTKISDKSKCAAALQLSRKGKPGESHGKSLERQMEQLHKHLQASTLIASPHLLRRF
ncbi:hypothetical protein HZ326_20048 [Fusarium oxysporum f. sp. albedinis]|nr:hypothetical protein HZ326_20048 [Fusarium oxysporum f. sp. albedinis]